MKILVGYDGSDVAKEALELAGKHALVWGAKVNVVNHMDQNRELKFEDIRKAEQDLENEVHYLMNSEKSLYETYLLISDQDPGEELVQFAELNKADEIIIGIQKKSKVGKFVFGSTAQYVVLNAPCPVVSVK